MSSALEAIIVVLIGFALMAFFIWTKMSGGEVLHGLAAFAAFFLVLAYGLKRTT